jgi:threonine/homoserine/homoserine lactone efflux protein
MSAISSLLIVIALQAGFIIAPGSDFALVLRTLGSNGRPAAVTTAFGIGLGCLLLLLVSIAGLNTILAALPILRTVIRYAGAVWLVYQAVLSFFPHLQKNKGGPGGLCSGIIHP